MDRKRKPAHQFELSKVNNSTEDVIKDKSLSEGWKDGGKVRNVTEHIDTVSRAPTGQMADIAEKLAAFRANRLAQKLGQKALGVVPFAGAGYAALSGDPAMAADEAVGDVPFVGQAYEAIRPSDSGNVEEERQMIAERNAQEKYASSPARAARLKALQGFGR